MYIWHDGRYRIRVLYFSLAVTSENSLEIAGCLQRTYAGDSQLSIAIALIFSVKMSPKAINSFYSRDPKKVTGKQCRARSNTTDPGIWPGSTMFASNIYRNLKKIYIYINTYKMGPRSLVDKRVDSWSIRFLTAVVRALLGSYVEKPSSAYGWSGGFSPGSPVFAHLRWTIGSI